jgi:hypothetical protein
MSATKHSDRKRANPKLSYTYMMFHKHRIEYLAKSTLTLLLLSMISLKLIWRWDATKRQKSGRESWEKGIPSVTWTIGQDHTRMIMTMANLFRTYFRLVNERRIASSSKGYVLLLP